jgi:hypothetical protein
MISLTQALITTLRMRCGTFPQPYRVWVCVDIDATVSERRGYPTPCPVAGAVMDDFGNLVLVTGWT